MSMTPLARLAAFKAGLTLRQLTQTAFARELGISSSHLMEVVRGRRPGSARLRDAIAQLVGRPCAKVFPDRPPQMLETPLPRAAVPVRAAPRPVIRKGPGRVLVVDDEPVVRSALDRALTSSGYRVTAAGSVAEAIQAIDPQTPFDCLVLDYNLGPAFGTDVYHAAIRLDPALADRVIFVTGSPTALEAIAAAAPNSHMLPKPFELPALRATVATVIASDTASASGSTESA